MEWVVEKGIFNTNICRLTRSKRKVHRSSTHLSMCLVNVSVLSLQLPYLEG